MPSSLDHNNQACRNLSFLQSINKECNSSYDWQVTVSFYVAVHLVNAHLAKYDMHYRSHEDVSNHINPFQKLSPSKLPENIYLAYKKLQGLSRRSRYLVHDDPENKSAVCHFTYDKHFVKAIKKVEIILEYFISADKLHIPEISLKCLGLKENEFKRIKIIQ